jgi:hypothetical protein
LNTGRLFSPGYDTLITIGEQTDVSTGVWSNWRIQHEQRFEIVFIDHCFRIIGDYRV